MTGEYYNTVEDFKIEIQRLIDQIKTLPSLEKTEILQYAKECIENIENEPLEEFNNVSENEVEESNEDDSKRHRRKRAFPSKRITDIERDEDFDDFSEDCESVEYNVTNHRLCSSLLSNSKYDRRKNYGSKFNTSIHSEPEITTNLNENYSPENVKPTKKCVCPLCEFVFSNYHDLLQHVFDHKGSQQSCKLCKCSFANAIAYNFHLQQKLCDSSNSEYSKSFEVDATMYEKDVLNEIRICPFCGIKFSKNYNLKRHLKRSCNHSSTSKKSEKVSDAKAKYNYECTACNMKFTKRAPYRQHLKMYKDDEIHKGRKSGNFWCKICTKDFSDQHAYKKHCLGKKHLLTVNENEVIDKSFMCEKCGVSFMNNSDLNTHISRMHKDKAVVTCPLCPYTTKSVENMSRHKYSCHEINNRKIICEKCPSIFKTTSALANHKKTVHSEVRKFKCDTCSKAFKLNSQLNRHLATHSAFLPFLCSYCPMGFRRKSHLQRHTHLKHEDHMHHDPMVVSVMNFNKAEKAQHIPMPEIIPEMSEDQVFSLIDVQSGELITLSASEMSKNAVINMTDTDLLSSPYLWNNLTNNYQTFPSEQAIYDQFL